MHHLQKNQADGSIALALKLLIIHNRIWSLRSSIREWLESSSRHNIIKKWMLSDRIIEIQTSIAVKKEINHMVTKILELDMVQMDRIFTVRRIILISWKLKHKWDWNINSHTGLFFMIAQSQKPDQAKRIWVIILEAVVAVQDWDQTVDNDQAQIYECNQKWLHIPPRDQKWICMNKISDQIQILVFGHQINLIRD